MKPRGSIIETVSGRRVNNVKNKNKKLGGANQSFALFTNLAVENAILTSHESLRIAGYRLSIPQEI